MPKPKIFICHCETNFSPTEYAIEVIHLMGCIPVIFEKSPKLSRPVANFIQDTMDACDAVLVIATPDRKGDERMEPSQGVVTEIGMLKKNDKFKGKYIIIKEESTYLGPMIPEAHYTFKMTDFGGIAIAILIELSSMGFFQNYYGLPGSELKIHELMEIIYQLKEMGKKGYLDNDIFKREANNIFNKFFEKFF